MLKSLIIKNLILVEETHLTFDKGLTVITGETGAGKTALIEAIRLILGKRLDATKVRKGCEKALIQASFELPDPALFKEIFYHHGVTLPEEEELILTREISASGKSRAFVSGELVPAAFLAAIAPYLVDFIGQNAQMELRSQEVQRDSLDQFANIDLLPYQSSYKLEKELEAELNLLQKEKGESAFKRSLLESQLKDLEELQLQAGEEESLFEEYTLLSNAQELLATSSEALEQADSLIEGARHLDVQLRQLEKYDPTLREFYNEASLPLAELHELLLRFQGKLESDPSRLAYLEERLTAIERLKKKHGGKLWEAQERITLEMNHLDQLDEKIDELTAQLTEAGQKTSSAALDLTAKRKKGAAQLEKQLTSSIRELNIPSGEVTITLSPSSRTMSGEDAIAFYLTANQGEKPAPLKDAASGGELSRLFFSLKLVLASLNLCPTLVFDEVDANVGGKTATILGEKLQELGKGLQVFCITHFPQVARFGNHHLKVCKVEEDSRTTCQFSFLKDEEIHEELLRMVGGEKGAISIRQ
jgi:DNA repair protein RecN (Recombination protein N)